uniref:Embigin n=1 Tax=Pogona vitticeps TaxID=103695 RepID=A0ABM5FTZ0_9SAUR
MRFPEVRARALALLLVAAALTCADADTSTPAMGTQNTQDISVTDADSPTEPHTSVPPTSMQGVNSAVTSFPYMRENITINEASVTKNVILEKPTRLELMCSLVINSAMKMEKMEVVWKIDDKEIKNESISRNPTDTKWCSQHEINVINKDDIKNYACVFKTEPEISAIFHLQVPEIHIKSKQIVSYVGDYVVLSCTVGEEKKHYQPSSWAWHTANGSEQVALNATLMPEKYLIIEGPANITKLKILSLSEKDSGLYWCEAIFPVGESKGNVSLTVLTYMTPLKPFLGIAAEVVILVAAIFIYEMISRKKEVQVEVEKEFEQAETLKSEDSNGVENSSTRQRKT